MPWQLLPNKPVRLSFNDVILAGHRKIEKGKLPRPENVVNSNNVFIEYSWDVFFSLGLAIKKRLKGKYPSRTAAQSKEPLFSFSYRPAERSNLLGEFILTFEEDWVATILNSSREIKVTTNCPWQAFTAIMIQLNEMKALK